MGWEQHLHLRDAQAKVEESHRVLVMAYDDQARERESQLVLVRVYDD